jgi:integrase
MAYIEKRGKDSFRLVVDTGFGADGKRIRRTKTVKCKNKSEAKKELAKFLTEVEAGEYIAPEKMTFTSFVDEWKEKYAVKHLSPKTFDVYLTYLNKRILPEFGFLRLNDIKSIHIIDFLNKLQKEGARGDGKPGTLSSATVQYHYRILSNIFNRAVEWKIIKESPVKAVKKPKVEQKRAKVFTEEQVHLLMYALKEEDLKWRVIVSLAITTGMRRGELLALDWENVNLDKGKIHINRSLTYTKEQKHIFKETKTRNSTRIVSLSKGVQTLLAEYKIEKNKQKLLTGDKWEGKNNFLLFSQWNGAPMHPSSITTWWRRFLIKHNLTSITFHELRHTSATLLINQGVHMKTISARLGHSKIGITMDLYGHALESADEAAAEKMDLLFNEK